MILLSLFAGQEERCKRREQTWTQCRKGRGNEILCHISLNPVPLGRAKYVAVLKFKGTGKPSPTIYPEDEENQNMVRIPKHTTKK